MNKQETNSMSLVSDIKLAEKQVTDLTRIAPIGIQKRESMENPGRRVTSSRLLLRNSQGH